MKSKKITKLNKKTASLAMLALGIGMSISVPTTAKVRSCADTCNLILNVCMREASGMEEQMACFDQNFSCLENCGVAPF
ncbi:hypothetical protein [Thalassomonas actiniarum]|uniref:Cys-rich protein n=1 Tax=Thalassomonas actiniarum TaxID=485447 RepID=A0AAE9YMI1_9GAMM|nr:hypothetical protein [Thalassomonas actiniarum]WDD97602.1 hypothetical protein SG35_020115 [Thalassomonas actiniarum]